LEDNIELYNKKKELLLKNKKVLEEKLRTEIEKYEKLKNMDIDKKEKRLELAAKSVARRMFVIEQIKDQISFLRPSLKEDIEYRLRQYNEFSRRMRTCVPDDIPLRFHGCPIYTAKRIIESGELSSSVDRLGFETSYDTEGQISVTTKESLEVTVQGYAGLNGNYELPAGCIFVLLPKDEFDAKSGESLLMNSLNIRKEPERLFAIITTPENYERLLEWCQNNNIEDEKIYEYDDFEKLFTKNKTH